MICLSMIKRLIYEIKCKIRGEISTRKYIKRGLKVGKNFSRQSNCSIDYLFPWLISIGDNVTLAPGVCILAHDASTKHYLGYSKVGNVTIRNNVFIGANTTVLPNVNIGNNVIIGANSLVSNDIPDNYVVAGNPAKIICKVEDYVNKNKELMNNYGTYDEKWPMYKYINENEKKSMKQELDGRIGFAK